MLRQLSNPDTPHHGVNDICAKFVFRAVIFLNTDAKILDFTSVVGFARKLNKFGSFF